MLFRFDFPASSVSGCTTRMCLVKASLRENVFSSVHRLQRTFNLRLLWMVSSCRVRSYEREKTVLHGLFVDGFSRSHLCGPGWLLRLRGALPPPPPPLLLPLGVWAEVLDDCVVGAAGLRCGVLGRWASRRCF